MKNIKLSYILVLFLSIITLSCKDNYDQEESFVQGSDYRIVNAATGLTTKPLKVYQDDKLLLNNLLYGTDSKYFRTTALNNSVNVKVVENNNVENLVLSINNNNNNNQSVTYFLISPTETSTNLEFVKTIDDVAQPDFNKVKVRVANLASNLPANVDLIVKNKNLVVKSNIAFKSVTDFVTIDRTDRIEIVYTGTSTVVKSFNAILGSKGVYTFVLGGTYTGVVPLTVNQFSNTL